VGEASVGHFEELVGVGFDDHCLAPLLWAVALLT
jgi:hypothetical protein